MEILPIELFIHSVRKDRPESQVRPLILEIGGGAGQAAEYMRTNGLAVDEIDFATNGLTYEQTPVRPQKYDGIYLSHVLEHVRNVGAVLDRIAVELKAGGILAVLVPPAKHNIVGGHLTLWNCGLLLYNLVVAGFDCRDAAVATVGYNCVVITRHYRCKPPAPLKHDIGDIETLAPFFPMPVEQGFDGQIRLLNWSTR